MSESNKKKYVDFKRIFGFYFPAFFTATYACAITNS